MAAAYHSFSSIREYYNAPSPHPIPPKVMPVNSRVYPQQYIAGFHKGEEVKNAVRRVEPGRNKGSYKSGKRLIDHKETLFCA